MQLSRPTLIIAIICTLLLLQVISFPPWNEANYVGIENLKHAFLFACPSNSRVCVSILLLEISGILCFGTLAWLIVKLVASRKGGNP